MLPGLRTLAATVVLGFAILIFAFGAAALLRAAHEDFAMLQTWRPAIDPLADTFAAQDSGMPTLAALRVEPEPEAREQVAAPASPLALPAPPLEVSVAPPAPTPPAAVVAALPTQQKIELPDAPYNVPLAGPRLMPEIATNDAAPVAVASVTVANLSVVSIPSASVPVASLPVASLPAAGVPVASLAPDTTDSEPLAFAPLPRPKPLLVKPTPRKRIVKRAPVRRVASRPVAQRPAPNAFQQLFNSGH